MTTPIDCTCPRIHIGTRKPDPDGPRNLSPDCPVHGAEARAAEDRLFGRDAAARGGK